MVLVARWSLVAFVAVISVALMAPAPAVAAERPEVTAKSAIVVDAATGQVLFDKNANTPRPPASLTKLFTAFAALEVATLDQRMTVTSADLVGEASMGLTAGETLPFEALLYGMLLPSGNDAASTIARNLSGQAAGDPAPTTDAFMAYLNGRVGEIGLSGTSLQNPHGLDQEGHVSTARDIAAMTIYAMAMEPAFAQAIASTSYSRYGYQLIQANELHSSYPGLIGGKTGVTDNAGYSLMEVAERDGRRVVVVLLGSTPQDWYADARALLDYGFTALATPGSPVYGEIAFQPDAISTAAGSAARENLAITYRSAESAIVSDAVLMNSGRQLQWFWVLSALVVAPCVGVAGVQARQLVHLLRSRPVRPAPAPVEYDPAPWNTQPFGAYTTVNLASGSHVTISSQTGRDGPNGARRSVAPSFGD